VRGFGLESLPEVPRSAVGNDVVLSRSDPLERAFADLLGGGRLLPRDRISGLASAPWQAVSCLVLIRDDGRAGGLGLTDTMELPAGYGASGGRLARRPSFVSVDGIYKCYAR
jgi:hypothetical protein